MESGVLHPADLASGPVWRLTRRLQLAPQDRGHGKLSLRLSFGNGSRAAAARVDRGSTGRYTSTYASGSSSAVECFLAKEDVAGSTPVSRSKTSPSAIHSSSFKRVCVKARSL